MSYYFMNYHMVLVLNEKMMKGTVMHIYFAVFSSERSFPTFSISFIMCDIWESLRGTWSGNKESGNRVKNRELLRSNSPQGNVYQCSRHPLYCIALWLCIRPSFPIGSPHLTYSTELIAHRRTHVTSVRIIFAQLHHHREESGVFASKFGGYYLHLWQRSPQVLGYRCSFTHVLFPKHKF